MKSAFQVGMNSEFNLADSFINTERKLRASHLLLHNLLTTWSDSCVFKVMLAILCNIN